MTVLQSEQSELIRETSTYVSEDSYHMCFVPESKLAKSKINFLITLGLLQASSWRLSSLWDACQWQPLSTGEFPCLPPFCCPCRGSLRTYQLNLYPLRCSKKTNPAWLVRLWSQLKWPLNRNLSHHSIQTWANEGFWGWSYSPRIFDTGEL